MQIFKTKTAQETSSGRRCLPFPGQGEAALFKRSPANSQKSAIEITILWQTLFGKVVEDFPIPQLDLLQEKYRKTPSNETLKQLTLASAPYLFTEKGLKKGIKMLESLPYNYKTCQWSEIHFDSSYQAKWIPQTIPTLILGGEEDVLTPLRLFGETKQFQRENIHIQSIPNAGHFPWIENPGAVALAFKQYYATVT